MGLQASGPIKISEIPPVFGGSAPHNLDEYYRGGSNVEASNVNASIPTSGTIKLTDFYSTGGPSIGIVSGSIKKITGTTRLFYDNETFSISGADDQTKLIVVYATESSSHTSSNTAASTKDGSCTITGKSTTRVLQTGLAFRHSSALSSDVMSAASAQFICNLGNESSFSITLGRENASGAFTGTGSGIAMIIQVDGVSFTSPFSSRRSSSNVRGGENSRNFDKDVYSVANKGFTVFAAALHPYNQSGLTLGTFKADGSSMDTSEVSTDGHVGIGIQNETTGGSGPYSSIEYTTSGTTGVATSPFNYIQYTIGNYAF